MNLIPVFYQVRSYDTGKPLEQFCQERKLKLGEVDRENKDQTVPLQSGEMLSWLKAQSSSNRV